MTGFHVNLGLHFARPYESQYAMVRRCLIANPGISLSKINAALKNEENRSRTIVERLRDKQLTDSTDHSIKGLSDTYRRQCPECARRLFHTDAYALPWLTRCPIHHCEFTSICPQCQQSWPGLKELSTRDCAVCGCKPLKELHEDALTCPENLNIVPIQDIYDFMQPVDSVLEPHLYTYNYFDYLPEFFSLPGCRRADCTSELFTACQSYCHPEFNKKKLKSLNISTVALRHKTSSLYQCVDGEKNTKHKALYYNARYKWNYRVMKRIIRWICSRTAGKHKLHLYDYSTISLRWMTQEPLPCPYCLALSIWFLYMMKSLYAPLSNCQRPLKSFLTESNYKYFYPVGEPCILIKNNGFVYSDKRFSGWYYRRCLEIAFIDIMSYVDDLLYRLKRIKYEPKLMTPYSGRGTRVIKLYRPYLPQKYDKYALNIFNDKMVFFYKYENPLEDYVPEKIGRVTNQCKAFNTSLIKNYTFRGVLVPNIIYGIIESYRKFDIKFYEHMNNIFKEDHYQS